MSVKVYEVIEITHRVGLFLTKDMHLVSVFINLIEE